MQTLIADLRFAVRTLGRSYGFTAIAVLTLGLGIGANTAMFSTLSAAFLRPLPFTDPDRLIMGRATFDGGVNPTMSAYDFYDYREQASTLQSFSAFTPFTRNFTVLGGAEPEQLSAIYVSWDLFQTLGVEPQVGRHFSADEGMSGAEDVVLIGNAYWQRRFGADPGAIGEILPVEGVPHVIVGVMPAVFHFVLDVDMWLPMRRDGPFANARRFHNWLAVGRLADGASLERAQDEVDAISARLEAEYPDSNEGKALLLTNLHEVLVEDQRASLLLLMAAVAAVLLIACSNVANLLLTRGSARRGELAVRAALGASRGRIVRQMLTESLVIAVAAGTVGAVLAASLQGMVLRLLPLDRLGVTDLTVSPLMLGFAFVAALSTSVVFGGIPALRCAPDDVSEQLRGSGRTATARRGSGLRGALVVAQVALSVVLLIGSGLMVRSLAGLASAPLGFDGNNIITAELRMNASDYPGVEGLRLFAASLLEQLRAVPGVLAAGMISQLPIRDPGNNIYVYDAAKPPVTTRESHLAHTRQVTPGYFEAMRIPLLAGRTFDDGDTEATPLSMVIDQTMADELFPGESALGKRIVIDFGERATGEVIGVVGPVRVNSVRQAPAATMYFSYNQLTGRTLRIATRTSADPGAVAGAIRDVVHRIDPNLPVVDLRTMDSLVASRLAGDRVVTAALGSFAAVAVALAVVGLYGVLSYWVVRRRREIGVRRAIGAPLGSILGWVLRRGMALVAMGLLLGLAAAVAATRLIESLLYGVEAIDAATFAGVAVVFTVVALVACLLPAWRATRVDPLAALRSP